MLWIVENDESEQVRGRVVVWRFVPSLPQFVGWSFWNRMRLWTMLVRPPVIPRADPVVVLRMFARPARTG